MPLELELDYDRGVPVYRQIYEAVLRAMAAGKLERDEQLPTIKELSKRLEINPNTAARAYRDLERDGYLIARRGRGTFAAPPVGKQSSRSARSAIKSICDRALAEAAEHDLSASDLIDYLQGEQS